MADHFDPGGPRCAAAPSLAPRRRRRAGCGRRGADPGRQGIAGARLGNTIAQVQAALGRPARAANGSNDFGRFRQETYAGGITVFYQGGRTVTSVATTGLGDRTAKGVGVGSSEAAVRANVPGVRCETIAGSRSCHTQHVHRRQTRHRLLHQQRQGHARAPSAS